MQGLILSCCLMGIRGSETSSESAKGDEQDEGMPPILHAFVLIAFVMFILGILVGRCTCTVKHVVHVKSEPPHRLPPTEHSQSSDEKKGHQSLEGAQLQNKTRLFLSSAGDKLHLDEKCRHLRGTRYSGKLLCLDCLNASRSE